ncbi:hypothetical protein NHQ30_011048 [Ciborinia camelliae]|nr:hypothetical protein NHQ30_011048 [Ciborinia camelliae]
MTFVYLNYREGRIRRPTLIMHYYLFSFLEHDLADSKFKEKSRVDEFSSSVLSDLEACHEMLVAVLLQGPQNIARDIEEVMRSEDRKVWKRQMVDGYCTEEECLK